MNEQLKELRIESVIAANGATAGLKTEGSHNVAAVIVGEIETADVTVSLEQSVDQTNWAAIPGSSKTLSIGQTCHMWNLSGVPSGLMLRVAYLKGTTVTGVLKFFKLLTSE